MMPLCRRNVDPTGQRPAIENANRAYERGTLLALARL